MNLHLFELFNQYDHDDKDGDGDIVHVALSSGHTFTARLGSVWEDENRVTFELDEGPVVVALSAIVGLADGKGPNPFK